MYLLDEKIGTNSQSFFISPERLTISYTRGHQTRQRKQTYFNLCGIILSKLIPYNSIKTQIKYSDLPFIQIIFPEI